MLQPKKTKFRKAQKGRMQGISQRGHRFHKFGSKISQTAPRFHKFGPKFHKQHPDFKNKDHKKEYFV